MWCVDTTYSNCASYKKKRWFYVCLVHFHFLMSCMCVYNICMCMYVCMSVVYSGYMTLIGVHEVHG